MGDVRHTERMDIFIDDNKNTILIKEKWKYNWNVKHYPSIELPEWTLLERCEFHHKVDSLIWSKWGTHFKLSVRGLSYFAQRYGRSSFTVNFDIKWVLSDAHWTVNVQKILPNDFERSNVRWNDRIINLDSEDIKLNYKDTYGNNHYFQHPVIHGFGHALGYLYDEYSQDSSLNRGFQLDYASVMNIGKELRNRHLDYVLQQVNIMMPNTQFYIIY